ncbi:MAG: GH92 family glycosyl hydrolase, partial [Saprospiraceae bacterium]
HYTWSVFHDVQGLIDKMGGKSSFVKMLDSVFVQSPGFDDTYYGGTIHEIREMQIANMGQYAHGNQPIQHMIYLYNYAAEPWKAQYWAREVMNRLYQAVPDGYCGDEDNGQTSAWYVFSALGFYPVCPATDEYVLGCPLFKKVKLNFENGNSTTISSNIDARQWRYVDKCTLNKKEYDANFLRHSELLKGVKLDFKLSEMPNKQRGIQAIDRPYSFSNQPK